MPSSGKFINCVQCQSLGYSELDCKTTEEWFQCVVCGYGYKYRALIDRKRQAEDPEHREFFKLAKDGWPIRRRIERKGYGTYYIDYDDSWNVLGFLDKPITKEDIAWFREQLARSNVNADTSFLSRWDKNTNQAVAVIGTVVNIHMK